NGVAVKRDGSLLATNSVDGQIGLRHALRPPEATAPRSELDPEDPLSPARQLDTADAFWAAGRSADAQAACQAAQSRLQSPIERFPAVPQYRRELARSWLVASLTEGIADSGRATNHELQTAVDLHRALPGAVQQALFQTYFYFGEGMQTRGEHDRA